MSGGPGTECLQLKEEDVSKFLLSGTHLGTQNLDFQMESYIYKRKPDGVYIINLRKTWEKLLMAARILVAIENPADICVVSARQYCQRSILKFAQHTGSKVIAGRFTPGIFTNQIQSSFKEPRILVINDPVFDHQAVIEASYVNIPVIAFCNTDAPLKLVDLAIPCNNRGVHSTGLMWWMLAREVLRMRGTISRETPWDVMVDLYFYRDPEEAEKEEATAAGGGDEPYAAIQAPAQTEWGAQTTTTDAPTEGDWSAEPVPAVENWGDTAAAPAAAPATSAAGFGDPTAEWARPAEDNWQAQNKQATGGTTDDWGAATTGEGEW